MLLDRTQLAAVNATYHGKLGRENLACLAIDADKVTATNGHMLVEIHGKSEFDPAEFPSHNGYAPDGSPFLLHRDNAKDLIKALPRKRQTMPILSTAAVMQPAGKGQARPIVVTDLETPKVIYAKPVDAPFPQTACLWPTDKPESEVGMMIELLDTWLTTMKAAGVKTVKLEIRGPQKAVVFSGKAAEEHTVKGLLMPCRLT